jgi:hypothetical protein
VACAGKSAIVAGRGEGGAGDEVQLFRLDLEGGCVPVKPAGLEPARIRSLSAEGETVLATAVDGRVFFSSDGGGSFVVAEDRAATRGSRFPPEAPSALPGGPVAARGSFVGYAARKGGLVRGGKGHPWSSLGCDGRVTELVFLDDTGTLVAAAYTDADDTTSLVRVTPDGETAVVARIGPARSTAESDGRVAGMAYDPGRGVLWVVGGFGVVAFSCR